MEKTPAPNTNESIYTPFNPAFLIIPYQLFTDRRLDKGDALVYGVIYWFEHLKDGKCTASNKTIGEYIWMTPPSTSNSIARLSKYGYVTCIYKEENKRTRTQITTNVDFARIEVPSTDGRGSIHRCNPFHPQMDRDSNTKKGIKDKGDFSFKGKETSLSPEEIREQMAALRVKLKRPSKG